MVSNQSITTGQSITVRFGDAVLQEGHTAVPNLVLRRYASLGITPTEMMFIIHIWQFWWTERQPFPSLNTIAGRMNISRRQARNYTQSLKEKQFLVVRDRFSSTLGQISSEYDFSPLLRAVVALEELDLDSSQVLTTPPRKNPSEGGGKNPSEAPRNSISPKEDPGLKKTHFEKDEDLSNIRKVEPGQAGQGSRRVSAGTQQGLEGLGSIMKRVKGEPGKAAAQGSSTNGAAGRPEAGEEDYQRIQHVILTCQREFGDRASAKSSSTRAWNIYQSAGVSIQRFEDALYKARSLTKEATAQITSEGEDPTYGVRRKIKMPYFFAVLEDILGLRQAPEKPLPLPKTSGKGRSSRGTGHGLIPHIEY